MWRSSSILYITESSPLEETCKFIQSHQPSSTIIPINHCIPKCHIQTPVENLQKVVFSAARAGIIHQLAELWSNHISDDSKGRNPLTERPNVSQGMSSGSHYLEEKLPGSYHWRISLGKENIITAVLNCTERFMV